MGRDPDATPQLDQNVQIFNKNNEAELWKLKNNQESNIRAFDYLN